MPQLQTAATAEIPQQLSAGENEGVGGDNVDGSDERIQQQAGAQHRNTTQASAITTCCKKPDISIEAPGAGMCSVDTRADGISECGPFKDSVRVHLASDPPDATIYYTLDGSDPSTSSPRYSGPVAVKTTDVVVSAIAVTDGMASEAARTRVVLEACEPVMDPNGGEYWHHADVAVKCPTPGASVGWVACEEDVEDGAEAGWKDGDSARLSDIGTRVIKARATHPRLRPSKIVASAAFVIKEPEAVRTPTFDPPGGEFATRVDVGIDCLTPGAVIRYTTGGAASPGRMRSEGAREDRGL